MRASGVILPIFSLPSNYGIGTLGKEAYNFVDFLSKAKQKYWQMLPVGPTSYGDSPYQSFSTFAGNPYFIDLDKLKEDGLLENKDIESFNYGDNENYIDYAAIYESRFKVLKIAYENGCIRYANKIKEFKEENAEWVLDYALFMALKDHFGGVAWKKWQQGIKLRDPESMEEYSELLKNNIELYVFIQFLFYKQLEELKSYANERGIKIIGDIPIYVAEDSADTWANPQFFMLDENLNPKKVAGCPPDAFSVDGQLWGNPIYDWEALEKDEYKWWTLRVKATMKSFDVIRIDHFRGFESYWAVPYGEPTAVNGTWEKGPGIKVFNAIKSEVGDVDIIAEDLGFITDEVRQLLKDTAYPGMKILQFAFDPSGESEYLPHNYDKNVVVYTGTHDNDTIKGWFNSASEEEREFCRKYTGMKDENDNWAIIRVMMGSPANTAIMQMQDLLNLGSESRINIPSTLGINWKWRMSKEDLRDELIEKLAELTKIYGR